MIGADVVALQNLARELTRSANDVAAARKHVNAVVVNHNAWFGPNFGMFLQKWGQLAVELTVVAARLEDAARTVAANAEGQAQVSRSLVSGGTTSNTGGVPGALFDRGVLDGANAVVNAGRVGLSVLGHELGFGQSVGDVAGVIPVLGTAITAIGLVNTWNDPQWSLGQKLTQSLGVGMDVAGGEMMSAGLKGHPLLFGAGMATTSWSMAIQAAGQADFSPEGINTVVQEIARDPSLLVGDLGNASVKVLTGFGLRIGGAAL